jgi:hypothetical protein
MTIYLYVKTHNKTGLKYLGKTVRKNPHKYKGSGEYWTNHIIKHGYEVTTEIIKECSSEEELKFWGLYYSELWNIVEERNSEGKKVWANQIPESGSGAGLGKDNISHLESVKQKKAEKLKAPGYIHPSQKPENKQKMLESHWTRTNPETKNKLSGDNHYSKKPGYASKLKGENNPFKRPEVQEKSKATILEKYGVENVMECPDIVSKVSGDNHYAKREGFVSAIAGNNHYTKKKDYQCKVSSKNHYTKKKSWKPSDDNKNFDHNVYIWQNKNTGETVVATRQHMIQTYQLKPPSVCALIKGNMKSYLGWVINRT